MESVILQLEERQNYKDGLKTTCRNNKVPVGVLSGLTVAKMRIFWQRTLKHYENNPAKAQANWFQNELRLFHWVLVVQSFLLAVPLPQLDPAHWQTIQNLFFTKPLQMLHFEARKLRSSNPEDQHRAWLPEESRLLRQVMTEQVLVNRWNEVSRCFYESSGGRLYRSGKQCRQQWFNHLDESKKHGQWTDEQDRKVLEFVAHHGHKWAQLCREVLPARTEHMIKNRFKSLLIRHAELRGLSQRKIIRKILAGVQTKLTGAEDVAFKIVNLRTYHTEQLQANNLSQDSLVDGLPPQANSIQIINNSCGLRQNQQEQEIAADEPGGHCPPLLPTPCILPSPPQQTVSYSPPCQITENILQPVPPATISAFLPTYYALYPAPVLFASLFPYAPHE